MPIYEFYCADCHTVFSFLSRTVNTTKRPDCPRCGRPKLERRVSRFAISKGQSKPPESDAGMPDIDEDRMEQAFEQLAGEADSLNEDDPRQMAHFMRKLCQTAGLPLNDKMEEAVRRLEAGEDPEKIEEDMGDVFDEDESPFAESSGASGGSGGDTGSSRDSGRGGGIRGWARRLRPPKVDETIYDM